MADIPRALGAGIGRAGGRVGGFPLFSMVWQVLRLVALGATGFRLQYQRLGRV